MAGTLADQTGSAPPEVQVTANPEAVAYSSFAPRSNPALQLAQALSELRPEAGAAAEAYAQHEMQRADLETRQAALKTQGASFAEATRRGLIEPTQNPWWIQAYNRNRAAVLTQNYAAQLSAQSATWAEQNDPAAFQKRYEDAIAQFGQQFGTDQDALLGFHSSAAPAVQQAVATNEAYNINQMKATRLQDISSLAGKAIMDLAGKYGSKLTANQLNGALEQYKQDWLGSGGTLADWNGKVLPGSVSDAAFRTNNPDLVNLAKLIPTGVGNSSVYDIAGVASGLQRSAHYIEMSNRSAISEQMQAVEFRQMEAARKATGVLVGKYGAGIFSGSADSQDMLTTLMTNGFSPEDAAVALRTIASTSNSIRELAANRYASYASSSEGSQAINHVWAEAATQGWTPDLETQLEQMVVTGETSAQFAEQVRTRALNVTGGTPGSGALKAGALRSTVEHWSRTRQDITGRVGAFEQGLARRGIQLDPLMATDLQNTVDRAIAEAITPDITKPVDYGAVTLQAIATWAQKHKMQLTPKGAQ